MKMAAASVLAATVASACCLGPVVLTVVGAGSLGASLVWLDRYRPISLGATALLLSAAFYAAYRPTTACDSCSPTSRRRTKMTVWLATLLVVALATFPYYVRFLF